MIKKLYWSISIFGLFLLACQSNTPKPKASLVLSTHQLNFGTIDESRDTVWQALNIKNDGNAPLHIEDIKVSCGCTIPRWSDQPIQPGDEQKISIALVTAEIGDRVKNKPSFEKSLVIRTNTDALFSSVKIVGSFKSAG